jgi:hypothetical protein
LETRKGGVEFARAVQHTHAERDQVVGTVPPSITYSVPVIEAARLSVSDASDVEELRDRRGLSHARIEAGHA